jgi:hypothetical protein
MGSEPGSDWSQSKSGDYCCMVGDQQICNNFAFEFSKMTGAFCFFTTITERQLFWAGWSFDAGSSTAANDVNPGTADGENVQNWEC